MKRIWAPWRKKYVTRKKPAASPCIFCRAFRAPSKKDAKHFVLFRSRHNLIVLNLYPYNNGHLMLVPNRHVASTESLRQEERLDLLKLLDRALHALRKALHPHGFNMGMNLGRIGGAGIPGHLHLHVVPRWKGDSNFMPTIAETKVISDSLEGVYKTLHRVLAK